MSFYPSLNLLGRGMEIPTPKEQIIVDLSSSLHDMKIYVKKLNEISIKTNIAELKLISNQHSNILKMHIDFLIENINK